MRLNIKRAWSVDAAVVPYGSGYTVFADSVAVNAPSFVDWAEGWAADADAREKSDRVIRRVVEGYADAMLAASVDDDGHPLNGLYHPGDISAASYVKIRELITDTAGEDAAGYPEGDPVGLGRDLWRALAQQGKPYVYVDNDTDEIHAYWRGTVD